MLWSHIWAPNWSRNWVETCQLGMFTLVNVMIPHSRLAGDRPMSPQFLNIPRPPCGQFPIDFHNICIVQGISAPGVGSSWTIYGTQLCASSNPICLSARSGYLSCTFMQWRVGRKIGSCRMISVQPLTVSTLRVFSIRFCSVGIGGSVLSILTKFHSHRSQQVMVDGCRSKLANVVSGVP